MKYLIALLLLLIILPAEIISQTADDFICAPVTEDPYGIFSITGGKYKPSKNAEGEYLRVLIAFVQFQGDNSAANDWLPNRLPGWAYSFLDPNPSEEYTDKTYSDFWNEMAVGDFDVIGNVFPDLITLPPEETYADANPSKNFSHTNLDAIEIIDDWIPSEGPGGWNWTPYDNWEYDPGTQTYIFNAGNADGYIDMIFMIYRNATYVRPGINEDPGTWFGGSWGLFTGAASLGNVAFNFVTNDGYTIHAPGSNPNISHLSSGITFRNGGPHGKWNTLRLMAHEYGHYLFGGGHTNYSGIMGGGTFAMNGWERIRVDQIQPIPASGNGNEYILGDFIETGDVLKIPVPYNNPSSTTYFLVENHQRTSSYDHIVRGGPIGGGWDYTGLGKGIYVYLIKYGNSYPGSQHEMLAADGYFDWEYIGDFYAPGFHVQIACSNYVPITERIAINRENGKNDRMPRHIEWCIPNFYASKWVDKNPLSEQYELTRDVMGDLTDAYNFGYNETITRWTNPSTDIAGTGHNISIQLYDESEGIITVKVSNSFFHALLLPPSKPQMLKVEPSANNHPYATWDENLEDDVAKYYVYKKTESTWVFLAESTNNYYEDETETYCENPPVHCGDPDPVYYRVTAVDYSSQESLPSNFVRAIIAGDGGGAEKIGDKNNKQEKSLSYTLYQNHPNPFNPTTTISYSIQKDGLVSLKVFDILGNEVANLVNENQPEGFYEIVFNAEDLPSGIYFYKLTSGNYTATKKLLLLK